MNASDILITAVGWAATAPREIHGDGVPYTDFRLAHTARRFDGQRWIDGRTVWFTVKAFRDLARNVAESVHKGQPVVVQGRLRTETWAGPNGERTTNVLEATAVGHNLAWGAGTFGRRVYRSPEEAPAEGGEPGASSQIEDPFEGQGPYPGVDPFAVAHPDGLGDDEVDLDEFDDEAEGDDDPLDEEEAAVAVTAGAPR